MIRNDNGDRTNTNNNGRLEITTRMLKFVGLLGTLSYVIPDFMLLAFICYNAIFFHDRVVWVRTDFGLSLGVVFGLRYYIIPILLAGIQIAIDFSLLLGVLINKKTFLVPALVYHGLRCILSVSAIVEFEQYVPDVQHHLHDSTDNNNVDIDTVRVLLLIFAAIEICSWLCIFLYFCEISGVALLRRSIYVHN